MTLYNRMKNLADGLSHTVDKKTVLKFLRNLESDIFYFKRTKNNRELSAIKYSIEKFISINSDQGSDKHQMRDLTDGLFYILQRVL